MLTVKAIKGVVKDGRIQPFEKLDAPEGTEVLISVPEDRQIARQPQQGKMITFGMFAQTPGKSITEDDLQDAKKLWEREWENSWRRLDKP